MLHDVAPVTRRVSDAQQDRLVFTTRALECLGSPRVPVDGIVRVLKQIRTGLVRESIGHCEKRAGSSVCRARDAGRHRFVPSYKTNYTGVTLPIPHAIALARC